ncbi:MAG: type II secretion system GspH family protein [Planctomycetota bacterium]|nr:type II secretion system GspH family protein [Planctomycetota bacterium]
MLGQIPECKSGNGSNLGVRREKDRQKCPYHARRLGRRKIMKTQFFSHLAITARRKIPNLTHRSPQSLGFRFFSVGHKAYHGFTLVELLVVMAIISLVAAMLLPVLGEALNVARCTACVANTKNFSLAMAGFTADYNYVPHGNCYAEQGEIMPIFGAFKHDYLRDCKVLICPTAPKSLGFKWISNANPYDPKDSLYQNFYSYNIMELAKPYAAEGQNVPMGTYLLPRRWF